MRYYIRFLLIVFILFPSYAEDDLSIGITWLGKSVMSERVTLGTLEVLNDLVPDLQIEILPNLVSESELVNVTNRFAREKDAIIIMRSSGAQFLVNNPQSIPSFIGAANHPGLLGVISNMERPGGNITGVTYYIDLKNVFNVFNQIKKDIDSVMLLYEIDHPGSDIDRYNTQMICNELNISYTDSGCETPDDIIATIEKHKDTVDAFIFGNQSLFFIDGTLFREAAGLTPIFSYSEIIVEYGALASLSADDLKLGRLLAGSIINVLYNGKRIGDIPIQVDIDPSISINITTAEKLGILIPIHILKVAEVYR